MIRNMIAGPGQKQQCTGNKSEKNRVDQIDFCRRGKKIPVKAVEWYMPFNFNA